MAFGSIARKLPLAIVLLSLCVAAGVGTSGYLIAAQTGETLTYQRLDGLASDRAALLRSYLSSHELAVLTAARSETVQNAIRDLHFGWLKLGENPAAQLQDAYVTHNPFPEGERDQLVDSKIGTNYDSAHSRVHPALQVLATSTGFAEIYLFDNDGNCIYSLHKGPDFAGAFAKGGTFGSTPLGGLLSELPADTQVAKLSDVADYQPAGNAPTAFMAAPVLDKRGVRAGAIAVRLPIAEFGPLINGRDGLGDTGEVVVVGADHLLRTESTFSTASDILKTPLSGSAIDSALNGVPAKDRVSTSYRGEDMLVDAKPLGYGGLSWAVVTMMSSAEAMRPVFGMGQAMLLSALTLMIIAGVAALIVSRRIAKPISDLTSMMEELARGRLDLAVPHSGRKDEIGSMARAVEVFRENGTKVAELTEADASRALREQQARATMMSDLQAAFGHVVASAADGDFSHRIETKFPDRELDTLAAGINEIVATVDRGLAETTRVLSALAEADLTKRVEGEYRGAFSALKSDTNMVAERFSDILSEVRAASGTLRSATAEILGGSEDLAHRTTLQSSTIENTSLVMAELSHTVSQNADRAREASELASSLTRTAEESGEAMTQATQSMEEITTSSKQISSIVGLINDIAFQTNLLALNASVEAARAGDAGRGFAVVAVEVRRLAQSAAKASADIKKLIERSNEKVLGGSKLVDVVANKMREMLSGVRASSGLVEQIAGDSQHQAASIGKVSADMRTLEQMTQHNAGLVEETNVAIASTERQVAELDRLIDIFTLRPEEASPAIAPRPLRRRAG